MSIQPVPVPDRVAEMIGATIPPHILAAERASENAAGIVRLCRTPLTREARELALADLARANKVLARFSPKLVLTPGGAA